ncbi:permease-like cell division protein FtsX [Corynebacterium rhinophilum]|uniref:permease-like cell division protein FtsX n=1 Tax=Corynebacterium rhinophilum TaxID=3050197 RepID=UPI0025517D7F|nr:permease-like cell division protein FtsX [Corynebacterium sp. MSK082]MDK8648528.1 permease-like cell division protein FtsX [Corynebacterium sp. MSK082]
MKLGFIFREASKGLGRNLTMTIAMIITTAISVGAVVAGIMVTNLTKDTKDIYLDRVEVMVQLNEDISATDPNCITPACADLKEQLESDSSVESVEFRNREASYERFRELFQDTDPVMVEQTSPDALPAALHVRLVDPEKASAIDAVRDNSAVEEVVDQQEEVREAASNLDSIRTATFIVAIVMSIAAIFLVANMVQIAAFHRTRETEIMRMVGASRWMTQAPFVVEAVFASLIGVVLGGAGLLVAKSQVIDPALQGLYESQLLAPMKSSDLWIALPLVGLLALAVTAATAQITLRSYVRR